MTYPLLADPQSDLDGAAPFPPDAGCRSSRSSTPTAGSVVTGESWSSTTSSSSSTWSTSTSGSTCEARTGCARSRRAPQAISVHDLTRFMPPEDSDPRRGAVLMLFGEGDARPRPAAHRAAHDMRSHPGQIVLPRWLDRPGRDAAQAALREAEEEIGLDPAGIDVFAELPELWLPPSNFAVTPVLGWWETRSPVGVVDPAEVHAVHQVPLERAGRPRPPDPGGAPLGLGRARLPHRRRQRPGAVGLHRGHHRPALRLRRLGRRRSTTLRCVLCPPTCCRVNPGARRRKPNTRFGEDSVNLLDWLLVVLVLAYALSGYWQGFITGAFATSGPAARRPDRRLARARLRSATPSPRSWSRSARCSS